MDEIKPLLQQELRKEMDAILQRELSDIKTELQQVRGMLERMVRVEERLLAVTETNARIEQQNAELFRRVGALETASATGKLSLSNLERVGWLIATGAASWFTSWKLPHP